MKLINSVGPNPKVVRMFAAELGIELDMQAVDLLAGENRQPEYMALNPSGSTPALILDNGDVIAEITAICEYLDDRQGSTDLIGASPEARAETRMWTRRIDLQIVEPLANGFRSAEGLAMFKDRIRTMPQAADDMKTLAQERLTWLDGLMEGKTFVCGDRFTLADVLLYCFLEFGAQVGQPLNESNANIKAWYDRVAARPSASA
ncbi:MAG: glutathione S-transferase family protein [Pseudomonadales bacterium]|nr:glutathione S-transferase family protein [Pseudomonadales bacterium]